MHKLILPFLFFMMLPLMECHSEPLQLTIDGEAAILMNADTGAILFEKEAYALRYPASTTKIATALYVLKLKRESLDTLIAAEQEAFASLTQEAKRKSHFSVPAYWLEPDGTKIGLIRGEELSLKDLLKGMLICSGNDAANVLALSVGGTIPSFMDQLNLYLKEIGCQQTHFCNPHGLHHPDHQTTPYDLALITKEALKEPIFQEIVSQARFMRPKTNKQKSATLLQTNRLLRPGKFYYPKAIGVKTGYHAKAKNTFVGAARSGDRTLIVVLLGYSERDRMFQDAIKLFDTAFNQPKIRKTLLKEGLQKFTLSLPKANQYVQTYLPENLTLDYYPAEDPHPICRLHWHQLTLPINRDQEVGELQLIAADGRLLRKVPLLSLNEVLYRWPYNWIVTFRTTIHNYPALSLLILGLLIIIIIVSIWILFRKPTELDND